MVLWGCGVVASSCCGVVVLWYCDVVVLWCCGVVVLWCCVSCFSILDSWCLVIGYVCVLIVIGVWCLVFGA